MKYLTIALAIALIGLPQTSQAANSERKLICRGANRGPIVRKLREDIYLKLTAASLSVKRLTITLPLSAARTKGTFNHDFSDDITVVADPFSVSFGGTLPAPEACTLSARLRIRAVLTDGSISSTTQNVTLPGTMLPARNFPSGESGLGRNE